jgi:hypothetical protein
MRIRTVGATVALMASLPGVGACAVDLPGPGLAMTIYANNIALVQDTRTLDITGGRQRIEFKDVSAQIRPETVSLAAAGLSIVEQDFDFDLLSPAKMMLTAETPLHETAVDEDVELRLGESPDVQAKQTRLSFQANAPEVTLLTPELTLAYHSGRAIEEVEITNARNEPTPFELRLRAYGALQVTSADHPMGKKDGRPIFRLILPASGAVKVRYAMADR